MNPRRRRSEESCHNRRMSSAPAWTGCPWRSRQRRTMSGHSGTAARPTTFCQPNASARPGANSAANTVPRIAGSGEAQSRTPDAPADTRTTPAAARPRTSTRESQNAAQKQRPPKVWTPAVHATISPAMTTICAPMSDPLWPEAIDQNAEQNSQSGARQDRAVATIRPLAFSPLGSRRLLLCCLVSLPIVVRVMRHPPRDATASTPKCCETQ